MGLGLSGKIANKKLRLAQVKQNYFRRALYYLYYICLVCACMKQ